MFYLVKKSEGDPEKILVSQLQRQIIDGKIPAETQIAPENAPTAFRPVSAVFPRLFVTAERKLEIEQNTRASTGRMRATDASFACFIVGGIQCVLGLIYLSVSGIVASIVIIALGTMIKNVPTQKVGAVALLFVCAFIIGFEAYVILKSAPSDAEVRLAFGVLRLPLPLFLLPFTTIAVFGFLAWKAFQVIRPKPGV